jgi:hypothetical protein
MAMPTGRSDKRITKEMAVELVRPDASQFRRDGHGPKRERPRDVLATEHVWRPGDPMLLSSPESDIPTEARVVYCQRMENNRFAVGLELLA